MALSMSPVHAPSMFAVGSSPAKSYCDISKFRRVIPRDIYASLRYYEAVVLVEGTSKAHKVCVVSEECILLLDANGYRSKTPEAMRLNNVIDVRSNSSRPDLFLNDDINKVCGHLEIVFRLTKAEKTAAANKAANTHRHSASPARRSRSRSPRRKRTPAKAAASSIAPRSEGKEGGPAAPVQDGTITSSNDGTAGDLNFNAMHLATGGHGSSQMEHVLDIYTWDEHSRLSFHIEQAWINLRLRVTLQLPVSIRMKGTTVAEATRLYGEVEHEILTSTDPAMQVELLNELCQAMFHDRTLKQRFLSCSALLQHSIKILLEGRSLERAQYHLPRKPHLELMLAFTNLIYAGLFNSECVMTRFHVLRPAPYLLQDLLDAVTADYGITAMGRFTKRMHKRAAALEQVQGTAPSSPAPSSPRTPNRRSGAATMSTPPRSARGPASDGDSFGGSASRTAVSHEWSVKKRKGPSMPTPRRELDAQSEWNSTFQKIIERHGRPVRPLGLRSSKEGSIAGTEFSDGLSSLGDDAGSDSDDPDDTFDMTEHEGGGRQQILWQIGEAQIGILYELDRLILHSAKEAEHMQSTPNVAALSQLLCHVPAFTRRRLTQYIGHAVHSLQAFGQAQDDALRERSERLPLEAGAGAESAGERRAEEQALSVSMYQLCALLHIMIEGTYRHREDIINFAEEELKYYLCRASFVCRMDQRLFFNVRALSYLRGVIHECYGKCDWTLESLREAHASRVPPRPRSWLPPSPLAADDAGDQKDDEKDDQQQPPRVLRGADGKRIRNRQRAGQSRAQGRLSRDQRRSAASDGRPPRPDRSPRGRRRERTRKDGEGAVRLRSPPDVARARRERNRERESRETGRGGVFG